MTMTDHAPDAAPRPREDDEAISAFSLRPDYPDFLNLPWEFPLAEWHEKCHSIVQLPRGLSRHEVLFVHYGRQIYALKELPAGLAEREYETLRQMEELRLPVVTPVGHVRTITSAGEQSVLITRFLEHSIPYHQLFLRSSLERYRAHLLDAMASLFVQIHLAGVYWGDISLSNALFRRAAGTLQAYFVDAETSEVHESLTDSLREADLDIMEENIAGGLMDLSAMNALPADYPIVETGRYIRQRYNEIWNEITREELIAPYERYRIQERVRALNNLGFSVDEVELRATADGDKLRMRAVVTDRNFHSDLLQSLTGLDAEENQSRRLVNEIRELNATMSDSGSRSTPLSVAAYYWLNEIYLPAIEQLRPVLSNLTDPIETYIQVLENKWYLSEKAKKDVGHSAAIEDFIRRNAAAQSGT